MQQKAQNEDLKKAKGQLIHNNNLQLCCIGKKMVSVASGHSTCTDKNYIELVRTLL
jgi:hypothetical protein